MEQESAFSAYNKATLETVTDFLHALDSASSTPPGLKVDSKHVINLCKAEVVLLEDLAGTLQVYEKLKKTPDQSLGLANVQSL